MAFVGAPITGTRKLMLSFVQLVSSPACTIPVFTLVSYMILRIPWGPPHLGLCCWGCTVTTLYTFWKIQHSKHYLNILVWEQIKVDFMGLVKWFLGKHFSWSITKSAVDVHMNQSGFVANLVKQFCRDEWDPTPDATPYRSGAPIDSIVSSSDADDLSAQF
jgi:hypothetical protein